MRSINALVTTAMMAFVVAGVASAGPSVSLVWTGCAGPGCGAGVGTNSIDAAVGTTATLDIRVTGDAVGVTMAALSLDTSASRTVSLYTQPGSEGIVDGNGAWWDIQSSQGNTLAPASATYSAHGAELVGTPVTCPGPPAIGNIVEGLCGFFNPGILIADGSVVPTDLGGGIIGSFRTLPDGPIASGATFTLGQLQLRFVPEPATGGLLALGLGALGVMRRRRAL